MPTLQEQSYLVPLTKNFKVLICGVVVFVLLSTALPVLIFGSRGAKGLDQGLLISLIVGLAVAISLIPLIFTGTRIDLLDESVKITTMKVFSKELPYSQIETVEVGPVTGLKQGAGLRILGGGNTGYLTGGPSLTFTLTSGSRVTVSTSDPEQVLTAVKSRLS